MQLGWYVFCNAFNFDVVDINKTRDKDIEIYHKMTQLIVLPF